MPVKVVLHQDGTRTLVIDEKTLARSQPWMSKAECRKRGIDPNKFYENPPPAEVFNCCYACPVRKQCLDYSYIAEAGIRKNGIWAGYTPRQRTNLAKGMSIQPVKSAIQLAKQRRSKVLYHQRKNAKANS